MEPLFPYRNHDWCARHCYDQWASTVNTLIPLWDLGLHEVDISHFELEDVHMEGLLRVALAAIPDIVKKHRCTDAEAGDHRVRLMMEMGKLHVVVEGETVSTSTIAIE